jgi:hypothetical protein
MSPGLLSFLFPLLLAGTDVSSFLFQENLECRLQKPGPAVGGGRLEFCILARPGQKRGNMPAVFFRHADGTLREIWRDRDRGFRPWKLELTELDGDPEPEIALGVFKQTRHDRRMAKRLFVYDWTGTCLFPKWLGSRLALPLVDFKFTEQSDGRVQRLVTLESGPEDNRIRAYRWNGFGFTGEKVLARSVDLKKLTSLFEKY